MWGREGSLRVHMYVQCCRDVVDGRVVMMLRINVDTLFSSAGMSLVVIPLRISLT